MTSVYGYVRISDPKQADGVSLEEQKSAIQAYAKRNSLSIVQWFAENKTAAKTGRPEFKKMLSLVSKNKARGVVFHKLDRGTRNPHDWAAIGDLNDAGFDVHFAAEGIDLNTRQGRLIGGIQAAVAADYIYNLREETKKGFYGRLKQGLWPLQAPLGYLDTGKGKIKSLDTQRAHLIRKGFELYATEDYSLQSLRQRLFEFGLTNKNGKKLSKNSLHNILRNPFYTGTMRVGTTSEVFRGKHKPLVSQQLFDDVQSALAGNCQKKRAKHVFLFSRLFTCQRCNYTLYAENQKGYTYYRCHTKDCSTKSINEKVIRETLQRLFSAMRMPNILLKEITQRIELRLQQRYKSRRKQTDALRLKLDKSRAQLERLTDVYLEQTITKFEYVERKQRYVAEVNACEQALEQQKNQSVDQGLQKFLKDGKILLSSYLDGDIEKKRKMLKEVTTERLLDGKNVLFELKIPYWEILCATAGISCDHHRDTTRTFCSQCLCVPKKNFSTKNIDAVVDALLHECESQSPMPPQRH